MPDREPRSIDPNELEVRVPSFAIGCNRRGRIRWALPNNSDEENLQLGLRNIQVIFLDKFPEFQTLYLTRPEFSSDRNMLLSAKEYILQRIGRQKQFNAVLGSSVDRKYAPYFNGSSIVVKQHLLRSWGIPFLFRDFKAGNDFWRRKTEEELIITMQEIWLESFPEFTKLFPIEENGKIKDGLLSEAKKYVLERVNRYRGESSFFSVFGGSPTTRDLVPSFEGSHIIAVKKTFASWGIEINVTDFSQARLWKGKTREEALLSFREIFLARFPEFKSFFIEGQFKVKPEKLAEATQFILNNTLPSRVFQSRFRGMISVDSPLKGGSAEILRDAFEPWGIHLKLQDLPIKNTWTDKTEAEVTSLAFDYFKVNFPEFDELLKKYYSGVVGVEQITNFILEKVGTHKKLMRVFHSAFQTVIKEHFSSSFLIALKRIFSPYLDNWYNIVILKEKPVEVDYFAVDEIEALARNFYLQHHKLTIVSLRKNKLGKLVRSINRDYPGGITELRNKLGVPQPRYEATRLQPRNEAARKVKSKRKKGSEKHLPVVDKNLKVYTDTEGMDWASAEWFYEKYGITGGFLSSRARDLGILKGVGANGHSVNLYKVATAIEVWKKYSSRPRADRDTGIYIDSNNERYAAKYWFAMKYQLSNGVATKFCTDAQKIEGRDKIGKEIDLYRISDVEAIITEHLTKLVIDEENGIAIDQKGEEWAAVNILSNEYDIDPATVKKHLSAVERKVGIGRNGHDIQLYDLLSSREILNRLTLNKRSEAFVDELLQEYTKLLRSGQIMSYEEFMNMKEGQND